MILAYERKKFGLNNALVTVLLHVLENKPESELGWKMRGFGRDLGLPDAVLWNCLAELTARGFLVASKHAGVLHYKLKPNVWACFPVGSKRIVVFARGKFVLQTECKHYSCPFFKTAFASEKKCEKSRELFLYQVVELVG